MQFYVMLVTCEENIIMVQKTFKQESHTQTHTPMFPMH